ncbi:MAG: hypothetical protein MJA29_04800, partial [Candidatus Omnitrophica bacterium]|nr:hypothetical protein [Candidatus Omnitrophota bacterium]
KKNKERKKEKKKILSGHADPVSLLGKSDRVGCKTTVLHGSRQAGDRSDNSQAKRSFLSSKSTRNDSSDHASAGRERCRAPSLRGKSGPVWLPHILNDRV